MVIIKSFLPVRIGLSTDTIYIKLAVGGLVVMLNGVEYHYLPAEATVIHVNRETGEVENKDAIFVFQHGKEVKRISMYELLFSSDLLIHLQVFIEPYSANKYIHHHGYEEIDILIAQLEMDNIRRSIDKALDERDEETFYSLLKML